MSEDIEQAIDVAAVRKELGLSQTALAVELGVDPSAVSHWEKGRIGMSGTSRRLLLRLLEDHRKECAA